MASKTSVIVALGSMVITLVIVITSYGLYRFEFKGKKLISRMIILAYAFPGILLIVPVYDLMAGLKLDRQLLGADYHERHLLRPPSVFG